MTVRLEGSEGYLRAPTPRLAEAHQRLLVLQELVRLTPSRLESLDLVALREAVRQRERLLEQLPPVVPAGKDDQEHATLNAECEALVRELRRRDRQILVTLEEARGRVQRLMQRVGAGEHLAAQMVHRTA